jgi:hypothetical protein
VPPAVSTSRRRRAPAWTTLPDDELLDCRFCDLGLSLAGSLVAPKVARLLRELRARGIALRPDFWIATDWFTPDDVAGVAIPFFVAHPRLLRLERQQMGEVEGGTAQACMRLLRHEAGHAVDHAYRLHERDDWRATFGRYTQPYRWSYHPRPFSKSYVQHLDLWYAQSHPAEDFAETFAVWLTPNARWRTRYAGWPALEKLEYVDWMMGELDGARPRPRQQGRPEAVSTLRTTLRTYYTSKRTRYLRDRSAAFDRALLRVFQARPAGKQRGERRTRADRFLRQVRPRIRRVVARWTGEFQYTVDRVLDELIERARVLDLVLAADNGDAALDAAIMLVMQTRDYVHRGYHKLLR